MRPCRAARVRQPWARISALGAWIGGVTITAGLGYTSTLWAGAALSFAGLLVLLAATRHALRRDATTADVSAAGTWA
jgi:DHA1 family inner membrane transport protein